MYQFPSRCPEPDIMALHASKKGAPVNRNAPLLLLMQRRQAG